MGDQEKTNATQNVKVQSCSPDGVEKSVTSARSSDFPVDVVYTWVAQPTQEEYDAILSACPDHVMTGGIQRLRNMGTFRFSLRMLEQHIPWVRHVFVITNGVIPTWINTSSPKLKLIQHRDIWPADRADRDLPVYNSQPIEVHLHRIPNLSERFLYFNDDMFVGRSLERSFFFADNGKLVLNDGYDKEAGWCSADLPGSHMNAHMPYALSVSMIQEIQARWPDHFNRVSAARCRGDPAVPLLSSPPFHYQWYAAQSNRGVVREGGDFVWLNDRNIDRLETWCHDQLSNPPDLGCINDDFDTEDTAKYERQTHVLLQYMRNMTQRQPSTFEKHGKHEDNISRKLLPRHVNGKLTNVPAMLTEDVVRMERSTLP